jgi:RND family efflux transporter MFP subunit
MKRFFTVLLFVLAGGICAGALVFWYGHQRQEGAQTPKATAITPGMGARVTVMKPKRRTSVQPAQVEPWERVDIVPKIPGFIEGFAKDLDGQEIDTGSRLTAGQVLATLAVPELQQELLQKQATQREADAALAAARDAQLVAQRDLEKYQADLAYREVDLQRHQKLVQDRTISADLVDEKQRQYRTAQAALAGAEARITQAAADVRLAQAKVETAKHDAARVAELLKYATLKVPGQGQDALYVVTQRRADPGAYVAPGSDPLRNAIAYLMRVDRVRLVANLPELDAAQVALGDRIFFQPAALPHLKLAAKVSRVGGAFDPQTRTLRIEADLPNPGGKPLQPGMFGILTLVLKEAKNLWLVPPSSLHETKGKSSVLCVVNNRLVEVPITVGQRDSDQVEVLGLTADSLVVIQNPGQLKPGETVAWTEEKGK